MKIAGLEINMEKGQLCRQDINYLGYKINIEGIEMEPERVKVIQEFLRPRNLKNLRGLLGMVNYFKRLVPDLSNIELPLIELLRKNIRWQWNQEREDALKKVKASFFTTTESISSKQ